MGKEETARNEQFLLFPQCFLLNQITVYPFVPIFDIISLFVAELEKPKIAIWSKGLNAFAYDNVHVAPIKDFVNDRVDNMGIDKNAS